MKPLRLVSLFRVLAFASVMSAPAAGQKLQVKFAPPVAYDSGPGATSAAVADLRRNGKLDVIVANYCETVNQYDNCTGTLEGGVSVLLGNGDGTFQSGVMYGTGAYGATSVAVGDVNGDGIPDLVVADYWQTDRAGEFFLGGVSVLIGNGDGTFQPPVVYSSSGYNSYSVALADLTGNGKLDIVLTNTYGKNGESEEDGSVSVLLGNGDGTFLPAVDYDSGGYIAASVAIGDVNGDGIPDLVVANYANYKGNTVAVLLGNGDGTFLPAVTYSPGGGDEDSIAVGDLRGDGILDVVVANRVTYGQGGWKHSNVGVLLGNGDGTFQAAVTYRVGGVSSGEPYPAIGSGYNALVVADVDGDGIPDVEVVRWCTTIVHYVDCSGNKDVSVLLGNGDGTLQKAVVYSSGGFIGSALAVADVNGDGRPDLIVVNECASEQDCQIGSIAVLLNGTYYNSKTALAASPNPSHVNQSVTFTATITPGVPNGEVVTFYSGKTQLGTGKTADGVATLTTSFSKAGKYTIKASYPGDAFRKASHGTVKQAVNP